MHSLNGESHYVPFMCDKISFNLSRPNSLEKMLYACLDKPTFTNSIPRQLKALNDARSNNCPYFLHELHEGRRARMTLRLADPFQLLTLTGPSAAGLHATCHTQLKCSALGDGEEQSFHQLLSSGAWPLSFGWVCQLEQRLMGKREGVQN